MNILWITNVPLPIAQEFLFNKLQPKEGWLVELSSVISKCSGISLFIASRTQHISDIKVFTIDKIVYFCFPANLVKNKIKMNSYWQYIEKIAQPDIVHIHGTELDHSLSCFQYYYKRKIVVSLQGIISVIERYYLGGIDSREFLGISIFNILRRISIFHSMKKIRNDAQNEIQLLSNVKYVIGRTDWDKLHSKTLNPNNVYFHLDEILRKSFYEKVWCDETPKNHTIFTTQANVPYKGIHMLLKALYIIKKKYPDVKLKIALGQNISRKLTIKEKVSATDYTLYLRKIIKDYNISENVEVLGPMNEKQIIGEYLECGIYVSSSAIENSSNSLCEAQILGVPAIATNVGGTETITENGKLTPMYRYEEYEILAEKIISLFSEGPNYLQLSKARERALVRHNITSITDSLIEIYKYIFNT